MNGCASCFRDGVGPTVLNTEPPALGDCSFCGVRGAMVWDVAIWRDHFARVLDMYERSQVGGLPLHQQFQHDWRVFSFTESDKILQFLLAVFDGAHDLLLSQEVVSPRFTETGAGADQTARWDQFREALVTTNRFFPDVALDLDFLRSVVQDNTRRLDKGLCMFRGRVCSGNIPLAPEELGPPPPTKALPGRGNPVGIAHLYLANSVATCLKECRAVQHGFVSVAKFEVVESVDYLDLVELRPENPFLVPADAADGDSDLVRTLVSYQFLQKLGHELSQPTRPGENQLEYVPTQYLCEFVKSIGVHGIRYGSSLESAGWNLVLFNAGDARLIEPVVVYEITNSELEFLELPPPESL